MYSGGVIVTEGNIIKVTREHSAVRQFVLVDLEGTANRLVSNPLTRKTGVQSNLRQTRSPL